VLLGGMDETYLAAEIQVAAHHLDESAVDTGAGVMSSHVRPGME